MKPLESVVVLDLTRFLAGPYCTLLLAGLGAEVIRVEPPGGDLYRGHPPFGGPKGTSLTRQTDDDLGLALLHRMRGKKSITLNLREAAGGELFRRLVARADVVVENFLPGTLEAMGLGFPALQAVNSKLVLCSISGFGQSGPYREWRAFDPVVQAMSGISSVTGSSQLAADASGRYCRTRVSWWHSVRPGPSGLKFTRYFQAIRVRPDRVEIRDEWIERVVKHPVREVIQTDGRIRRWAQVPEMESRYLRVVLLADGETVHNAFFDRSFKS